MYNNVLITILLAASFLTACEKNDNDDDTDILKGLVSFKQDPVFSDGKINFIVTVQFGAQGEAVEVEYDIMDGDSKISSGKANCSTNPDGLGMFWESQMVAVTIDQTTYKGKTLTVFLDPANKVTANTYTNETYVNLYKKESILIP